MINRPRHRVQDRGGLPGTPPTFRGLYPSRIPCCPGSKSEGAGWAAAGEGQEAARRGFLQGPKGLAWEGRVRRKGPQQFRRPLSWRGRPGYADGERWDGLEVPDD